MFKISKKYIRKYFFMVALFVNKLLLGLAAFSAMFWLCWADAVSPVPIVLLFLSLFWVAFECFVIIILQAKNEQHRAAEKYSALEQDRIRRFNSGAEAAKDYI